jgi:hypothetical protein
LAILASSMKRETALKVEMSSWSKPTIMPHRTSRPWAVGASEAVEIDVIDILVYQRHAVMVGHERGEQGEARHGQVRALTEQTDAMLHAPEGGVEARIDDDDIGHGRNRLLRRPAQP